MNHCCLIGGGGFIGSYVTGALLAQGRQVTILDTRPAPRNLPRAATYVVGDYGNKEMLRKVNRGRCRHQPFVCQCAGQRKVAC